MKCPRCQHESEAGAKFCEECATPNGEIPLAPPYLVFPGGRRSPESLVADDAAGNVALLKLEQSLPAGWEPVPLMAASACPRSTPFLVRGYPAQRPFTDPDRIDGHVVDTSATAFGGVPVVALFSPQVAAPVPRDPHGFSGAPVLVALGPNGAELAIALVRWGEIDPISEHVRAGGVLAAPLSPEGDHSIAFPFEGVLARAS